MRLEANLQQGLASFVEAVESTGDARVGGWTVRECVEHVVLLETRYCDWIEAAEDILPAPDPDRELRMFLGIRNRLQPMETPAALWPEGRYRDLPEAIAAFREARARTLRIVRERGDGLYRLGVQHPYFGAVNGAELIQLIDGHTRRHAEQIAG